MRGTKFACAPTAIPRALGFSHSNEKCYARSLGDCSNRITKEHFVSRAILARLDGPWTVEGLPWQEGSRQQIGISSLVTKCLCENHNAGLSALDACAIRFFEAFACDEVHATESVVLVSADDLARWMLKILIGMFTSGNARLPGVDESWTPPPEWIEILFGHREWQEGAGLFLDHDGGPFRRTRGVAVEPLYDRATMRLLGARIEIARLPFWIVLDDIGVQCMSALAPRARRPVERIRVQQGPGDFREIFLSPSSQQPVGKGRLFLRRRPGSDPAAEGSRRGPRKLRL